jgi:ATP-dependent Clp protease ATP-binding subunit ClpA
LVLAHGKIQIIGAFTIAEYRKGIEKHMALERRCLNPIIVKQLTMEENVLKYLVVSNEKYQCEISYVPDSFSV